MNRPLHLTRLTLINFKNYEVLDVSFNEPVNCLIGKNGSGKTNLLDAIHFLCLGRSFINYGDHFAVRDDTASFDIKGVFELDGIRHEVRYSFSLNGNKELSEDGTVYDRLSAHIGKYPLVLISPLDQSLITEASETRRKFVDTLLAQIDHQYLHHLIAYNQCLKQRNALLRSLADSASADQELIEAYDITLAEHGKKVYERRGQFITQFRSFLITAYANLTTMTDERIDVQYRSDLDGEDFYSMLKRNFQRDVSLQRTSSGPHRDDFLFRLDDQELKRRGSQGQQKSLLIALKLAQFDMLVEKTGIRPLLCMDDIFDKLDEERIQRLLHLMQAGEWGQVFLTDARPERTRTWLRSIDIIGSTGFFLVEQGQLKNDEQIE